MCARLPVSLLAGLWSGGMRLSAATASRSVGATSILRADRAPECTKLIADIAGELDGTPSTKASTRPSVKAGNDGSDSCHLGQLSCLLHCLPSIRIYAVKRLPRPIREAACGRQERWVTAFAGERVAERTGQCEGRGGGATEHARALLDGSDEQRARGRIGVEKTRAVAAVERAKADAKGLRRGLPAGRQPVLFKQGVWRSVGSWSSDAGGVAAPEQWRGGGAVRSAGGGGWGERQPWQQDREAEVSGGPHVAVCWNGSEARWLQDLAYKHLIQRASALKRGGHRERGVRAFSASQQAPPRAAARPQAGTGTEAQSSRARATVSMLLELPNLLSLSRMLAAPAVSYCILTDAWPAAALGMALAGLSDWLDGLAARWQGRQTVLGSYLDPLADKVLICAVVGALGWKGLLTPQVVAVVMLRDFLLVAGAVGHRLRSFGWQWPGFWEFFRVSAAPPPATAALPPAGRALPGVPGSDRLQLPVPPSPSHASASTPADFVQPLMISKVNTVAQLLLIASCLAHQASASVPPELGESLTAVVICTSLASAGGYAFAYSWGGRGVGTPFVRKP